MAKATPTRARRPCEGGRARANDGHTRIPSKSERLSRIILRRRGLLQPSNEDRSKDGPALATLRTSVVQQ
eukprot:6194725-Pleurochrysis_carterae.AAC.4